MHFLEFERFARSVWDEVPAGFKQGVDGLIVKRQPRAGAQIDLYTLGECVTEEFPSEYGGPETIRSAVVLYYGSFRELALGQPGFDWQYEIRETIMHELQHHLESLATEDALEDVDYANDENFKRLRGERFDPLFYRATAEVTDSVRTFGMASAIKSVSAFRVADDEFMEVVTTKGTAVTLEWERADSRYRAELPAVDQDIVYHYLEPNGDGPGSFCIVRVVSRGAIATLRAAFGAGYRVLETTIVAERIT